MNNNINPDGLFQNIKDINFPPVEMWNPPYCGKIDICIHKDGHWSYNNTDFARPSLVKMFSRVLKRENNNYYLVTPVEKVQITVEAEPFLTVDVEQKKGKSTTFVFKTNFDEIVVAGKNHPIKVVTDQQGQPYPTILIRNNLHALISRSDFYKLVDLASTEYKNHNSVCYIESAGCKFILGEY